jgi:hypothetical protein
MITIQNNNQQQYITIDYNNKNNNNTTIKSNLSACRLLKVHSNLPLRRKPAFVEFVNKASVCGPICGIIEQWTVEQLS